MIDRNIAATALLINAKENKKMTDDNPILIQKDSTNESILVRVESILRILSNTQPGKKNEMIIERMKLMFAVELANILKIKTATEHIIKK
jgi:hypothetical protein